MSGEPLRVLLVEDVDTDAKLVVYELQKIGRAIECQRVDSAAGMRAALERGMWDIVISDWSMPSFSAPAALALLKEFMRDIPFIIVSGTIGEEAAVVAMRTGAHDYVLKDKLSRLVPAVERELRECETRRALAVAEQRRRDAEQKLQRMVDSAMVGIWAFDAEGNTSFMNPRMAAMLGMERDEAMRTPISEIVDDERRLPSEHLLSQRGSSQLETRLRRKDGTTLWALVESSPMPALGAGAAEGGAFAMVMDVTERKKAQAELRASEERFSLLAASGIIGVVFGDLEGNIYEANDAFLSMVGYSHADLTDGAVRWSQLTPPEWQAVTDAGLEELRREGVATPYEKEYLRKDGRRVPVLVGIAMLDEVRMIAFMVDITLQKRAEEALRMSDAQLRQAQKMEAVGRLAGGIAHDFNNLLSVILSYCSIITSELPPGDPLREDIEQMHTAGNRAAELTGQLLTFSRQGVVDVKVLDLNVVLANTDKILKRILGEDVDLVTLLGSELGRVRVNPTYIEQVIMNLAVNSRDAMPTGGHLTIETKNVFLDEVYARDHLGVMPGAYVMLAVTDSGSGMDRATQARIFEPFFTTKELGKGTGLGLSTVFGIVQQSHGSIWVYSEPGHGTTFKMYFPRVDAEADAVAPTVVPVKLGGTETILLVEDEEQIRVVARGILRKQGYQVIEARNAGEALLQCESYEGTIHLLLTDVVMPRMSGPVLAKRLAQLRPGVKVLCMSGYTDDALVRHGAIDSGIAYLQKPITPDKLTRKVRTVLDSP